MIEPAPNQDIEEYRYAYRVRVYDDAYNDIEGFFDKASGFYQPPTPEYQFVMLWGEDGKGPIAVENSDGLTGYVDRTTADDGESYLGNGEKIVPPYYLVDAVTGERTEYPDYESSWEEESAVGWGIARIDGTILSGPDTSLWYIWEPDSEGMLCILSDDGSGSLCGHMNLSGRVIVPPKYRIDKGGAIPCCYFRNGYAVINDLGENWRETERYVIIDTEGNEVFPRSAVADSFSLDNRAEVLENDLIWYKENGLYGLIKSQATARNT